MALELKVGDPAPEFTAMAIGGKYGSGREVSLKELRGKPVVLYFYPKDDTPGCTVQACGLRDAWSKLEDRGELFGVSVDSTKSHEKFIGKYHLKNYTRTILDEYAQADGIMRFADKIGAVSHIGHGARCGARHRLADNQRKRFTIRRRQR